MQVMPVNDHQLIAQYLEGDERAFKELLDRYQQKIYTSIYLFVKDETLAEDIFQEVFIKANTTTKASLVNGHCASPTTFVLITTAGANVGRTCT
jgi:DNA-directed RNA polymerase specialized sigma24 family protein